MSRTEFEVIHDILWCCLDINHKTISTISDATSLNYTETASRVAKLCKAKHLKRHSSPRINSFYYMTTPAGMSFMLNIQFNTRPDKIMAY